MSSNHWPLYVDLSRDESKRILRRMELEAYGSVISAFRAQGDLSKKKSDCLQNLQKLLSISTERHRAEVRRATNDEELTTIAANISGLDVSSEWQVEGRRLIPLLPRLVPQTAFTLTANSAASVQAEKNASLPSPSQTATAPAAGPCPTPPSASIGAAGPKMPRPASPNSNVVVLPSGMSIHIKGLTDEDESPVLKKRRRSSSSSESSILVSKSHPVVSTMTSSKVLASGMASSGGPTSTPMKITFSKSPVKSQTTITPSQKVILVSSSQTATGANILQRSLNVPVVKATTSVSLPTASSSLSHKPSIIVSTPMATTTTTSSYGNIITVASSAGGSSTTGSAYVSGQNYVASTFKPRTKTITTMRHRAPNTMGRGSRIIPVGGGTGPVHPSPQGMQNIHIKPVVKPTIHIKQEGGMKIITQGVPQSANKILPKPSGGGSSPVVVVTTVSSPGITMVTKSAQGSPMGSRVLNITTQGGKVIATTSRSSSGNVVTVNPKTLQLTAIKGATGAKVLASGGRVATATGTKPNVIVVQKAQPRGRGMGPGTPTVIKASSSSNNPFEKELVSFIQRQDSGKTLTPKVTERKLIAPKPSLETLRKTGVIRQRSEPGEGNKSSLLAELIQAVGIINPDGTTSTETIQVQEATSGEATVQPGTSKGGHRWVEYDAPAPRTSLHSRTITTAPRENSTAIKALLDLRPSAGAKVKAVAAKSTPIEYGEQEIQQSEVYTIDSLGNLIPQSDKLVTSPEELQFIQSAKPGTEEVLVSVEGGSEFAQQVTSLGGEILGELDPQTGIFYNTGTSQASETVTSVGGAEAAQVKQVVLSAPSKTQKGQTVVVTTSSRQMDFLTSALSQANIDLDSYHFIEDDESGNSHQVATQGAKEVVIKTTKMPPEKPSGMPMMSLLTQQPVAPPVEKQESIVLTQEETPMLTETVVLEENVVEMPIDAPLKHEEVVEEQICDIQQQQQVTEAQQQVGLQQQAEEVVVSSEQQVVIGGQRVVIGVEQVGSDVKQDPDVEQVKVENVVESQQQSQKQQRTVEEQVSLAVDAVKEQLVQQTAAVNVPTTATALTLTEQDVKDESKDNLSDEVQVSVANQPLTVQSKNVGSILSSAQVQQKVDSQTVVIETAQKRVTHQVMDSVVTPVMSEELGGDLAALEEQWSNEVTSEVTSAPSGSAVTPSESVVLSTGDSEAKGVKSEQQKPVSVEKVSVLKIQGRDNVVASVSLVQSVQSETKPQSNDAAQTKEQLPLSQPSVQPSTANQPIVSQPSQPSGTQSSELQDSLKVELSEINQVVVPGPSQLTVTSCSGSHIGVASVASTSGLATSNLLKLSEATPNASNISITSAEVLLGSQEPATTTSSTVLESMEELSEISSTQDLTSVTLSNIPISEASLAQDSPSISNLPSVELPDFPQPGVSHQDNVETVSIKAPQPDTSSNTGDIFRGVVVGNQRFKLKLPPQEPTSGPAEAAVLQNTVHVQETASDVISSTQDDDNLQSPVNNVIVMETGIIDKPSGSVIDSSQPIHVAGAGVTVAYQPQAEIVSYTSQVEHIDSSGDHEAYDYDDPMGSPSAGGSSDYYDDPSTPLRNSKRKRKPPRAADESPPPTPQVGWIKMAVSLLLKISRFRGMKDKTEPNASIWFLEPVSAIDVPDYYDIIKKPMDFSKIKRKLENGEYRRWDEFNADMMLIRENCFIYNPPGSVVRADCDQVFNYYLSEYGKTVAKWQKNQLGSPAKKIRPEKPHPGHL